MSWTQDDLSTKAKINKTTLADFEREVRNLKVDTLEKAGIRFENDEIKYRVDLLKKK